MGNLALGGAMKSFKTLALVVGLLGLSGVSQAQFSSTWTAVSDYDFRGYSQSAKDPALQGSADYAFGDSGLSIGAWASNVDFSPFDGDIELDLYANYVGEINETFSWTAGVTRYMYPGSDSKRIPDGEGGTVELAPLGEYFEGYVGFNAGNFSAKQWYSNDFYEADESAQYTEVNYTQPFGDQFSLAFHAGYAWGDYWDSVGGEVFDYAVQGNYTVGNFTLFAKFTGTDASGDMKVRDDVGNNEPRVLIGVMTTLPWGE
jgi:uncharacterized protein (TIGR02001 family)